MIETQMAFYLTHTTTNQDETWYTRSCIGTHHKNKSKRCSKQCSSCKTTINSLRQYIQLSQKPEGVEQ